MKFVKILIISLVILIASAFFIIITNIKLSVLVDFPHLIPSLIGILITYIYIPSSLIFEAFSDVFRNKSRQPRKGIFVFSQLIRNVVMTSSIVVVMGVISTLYSLSEIEIIGSSVSLVINGIFYALIWSILFLCCKGKIEKDMLE